MRESRMKCSLCHRRRIPRMRSAVQLFRHGTEHSCQGASSASGGRYERRGRAMTAEDKQWRDPRSSE